MIVLLILAGISITMLSGENGILTRAGNAKIANEKGTIEERLSLAMMDAKMKTNGISEITQELLKDSIDLYFKKERVVLEDNQDKSFSVIIGENEENKYTIEEDGTIIQGLYSKWNGIDKKEPVEQTENEIHINEASELKWLSDQVNNEGITFEGYTIYLENNIDLGARKKDENWETEENEIVKWTAIGKTSTNILKGTFEGNNHTIKGMYINDKSNFNGIFGNANSILNLTIKNSYVKGQAGTAGIVGWSRSGVIENCHNINTQVIIIDGQYQSCGGIAGQVQENIRNCSNSGKIQCYGITAKGNSQVGGVVGILINGNMENCENRGKIEGKGICTGGVAGAIGNQSTMSNCKNFGTVLGQNDTGGVVGTIGKSTISNCSNSGNITGKDSTGGVVGKGNSSSTISNCSNSGNITGGEFTGGVAGTAGSTVTKCYNSGNVTGTTGDGAGGVVGSCIKGYSQNISLCYNSGTVTAEGGAGGISGYLGAQGYAGTETKCYNKGEIIYTGSENKYGEIVGNMASDAIVTKCFYLNKNKPIFGIGAINSGGDIEIQRNGAQTTNKDITSFEEFLEWIEQQSD